MRNIIAIILVLIGFSSFGQTYLVQPAKWKFTNSQRFDSTVRMFNLIQFTGDTVIGFNPYTKKFGYRVLTASGVTSVSALTLGTSGTDLSSTVANSTTTPVITLNVPTASASNRGALSSTDWSTFNGKLGSLIAGNGIIVNSSTIYRDSLKSTGQYGNSWQNGMYLGSSNNRSMVFRTNNQQRLKIDTLGKTTLTYTGTFGLEITTSQAANVIGFSHRNVNAGQQSADYVFNDRDPTLFTSYGGRVYGGSTYTSSTLFGLTRADKLFMFADGSNNLGMAIGTLSAQPLVFGTNNAENMRISSGGNVTIGSTTSISKLAIPVAPTASANYGLVSFGSGAFDGSTAGFFSGSASGTTIAVNNASGYVGDLLRLQIAGVSKLQVDKDGNVFAPSNAYVGQSGENGITFSQLRLNGNSQINIRNGGNLTFVAANLINTLGSVTGSASTVGTDFTQTWNTTGNPTAIKLNVTNTASGATSKLLDLQVGGVSKFKVDNSGNTTTVKYYVAAMNTAPSSASDTGTLGEIRVTATYIYVCTATNTWVRTALATW